MAESPQSPESGKPLIQSWKPLDPRGRTHAVPSEADIEAEDDDFPWPGLDPDHPCPKCGMIPMAPGDGCDRICFEDRGGCGHEWSVCGD